MSIKQLFSRNTLYRDISSYYDDIREFKSKENEKVIKEIDKQIEDCKQYYKNSVKFKIINEINHLVMSHKIKSLRRIDHKKAKEEKSLQRFADKHFSTVDETLGYGRNFNEIIPEVSDWFLTTIQCHKCFRFIDWTKIPAIRNYNPAHHPNYVGNEEASKFAATEEEWRKKEWFRQDSITVKCPYCGAQHQGLNNDFYNWGGGIYETENYEYTRLHSDKDIKKSKKEEKLNQFQNLLLVVR